MIRLNHVVARQVLIATVNDQREILTAELQRAGVSIASGAPLTLVLSIARQDALTRPMSRRALTAFEDAVRPALTTYLAALPADRAPRLDLPLSACLLDHYDKIDDATVTRYTVPRYERVVKWLRRAFRLV